MVSQLMIGLNPRAQATLVPSAPLALGEFQMWKAKLRKQILTLSCCSCVYLSFYGCNDVCFMNPSTFCGLRSFPSRPKSCSNAASSNASFLPSIEVLEDLGIYAWKPPSGPEKPMGQVAADDIRRGLRGEVDDLPRLVDLNGLKLPVSFRELNSQCMHAGRFPFYGGMMACLHVAAQKGVDLRDVDFLIGGSIFAFLCGEGRKDATFLAQKCPGTNIVVISRHKTYQQNFGQRGFQFERLVTGQNMYGLHDLTTHEHLQLLRVGNFRVLITAEVDAVDAQGRPVEIKSGNPRFFGIKEILQMISSGSRLLVHPYTQGLEIVKILCKSIGDLAHQAGLEQEELQEMDGRIVAAFQQLDASKQSMTHQAYCLLRSAGQLQLASHDEALLPQQRVVQDLLKDGKT